MITPDQLPIVLSSLDRIGRIIETSLLVILLSSLMLVAASEIALREIFSFGFIWVNEFQHLTVLWLAMIATMAACRDNRHIRIDALSKVLPELAIKTARVIVDLFAASVCMIVAWQALRFIQLEREFGDSVLVQTPAWLAHSIVPIAFVLTAYHFLVGAARKAMS